jgi:pilus assembly protein CpaB
MKWAVVALCLLGSVAAASAALLVHALRVPSASAVPAGSSDVTVITAKKALPAMTVIDSSLVDVETMAPDKAPANCITSPIAVVGRVLTKPIVEGQAFTAGHFADPASGQQLAAVIPNGKRAVGISVTNYAGLDGLLTPGAMVDVMVSLKAGDGREAVTTTLLENVQVLAIGQQTVVSQNKIINPVEAGRANETHCVTLLVDSKQAKSLQKAMEQGNLSLALRNPLDMTNSDHDAPLSSAPVPAAEQRWEMTIMRGGAVETQSFPMPDSR